MLLRTADPFRDIDRLAGQLLGTTNRPAVMPMDAWREGDVFQIEFDLPGVSPDSIDLDVERNVLTVRAERLPRNGDWEMLGLGATPRHVQPSARVGRQPRSGTHRGELHHGCAAVEHPGRREGKATQDPGDGPQRPRRDRGLTQRKHHDGLAVRARSFAPASRMPLDEGARPLHMSGERP